MTTLYHYTCAHSLTGITRDRELRPNRHPFLPPHLSPVVWLTDLETPDRAALGLTSHTLACDRTEHRVLVDTDLAVWWPRFARRLTWQVRDLFEGTPGALPMHWWVAEQAVPIVGVGMEVPS